ncbi:GTP-binding protein [Roseomonas sp. PWR1]|uniref:GTP-binding protein n=1 Tax=Roseomonas nitratireducens TaxID=2820810 RepID=A0ABS4ANR8_9PROT|nr:GTP-binding protein [Neoroseomonas nitratireducens]MBP0463013.1 GTP-binding protein [Neoroseomonas nitratireducens]
MTRRKIPVTVLTGFLGAGKTTLLNRLLKHPAMTGTAVLINEFGEVGLDHLLVERLDGDTVLLQAGCICCTVRGDLVRALGDLAQRAEAGQEIRRVVIETTGLADPAPILQTLISHPLMLTAYALDGVVTLVDAVAGDATLDTEAEAVKQAAMADRLVLTKTDLATREAAAALEGRLRILNPVAPVLRAMAGDVAPEALLGAGPFSTEGRIPAVAAWLAAEETEAAAHAHRHADGIEAFALVFDDPLPWDGLATWLEMLTVTRGDSLLRVKGLLNIAGEARPVVVHGVQRSFHPPARLAGWPLDHDRRSRIVFVTRNLPRGIVEDGLNAFLDAARQTGILKRG